MASRKEKREKEGKKGKIASVVEERRREGRIPSFVKDSLTRSLLASGIISRGAGLRISDNGGLDYATTLFPPFFPRLSPLLFFPSPFSLSFSFSLSLCFIIVPEFPPQTAPFVSRLKSDDIWPTVISESRAIRGSPEICTSLVGKVIERTRDTIHRRCRFVSFFYPLRENWPSVSSPRYTSLPYLISV